MIDTLVSVQAQPSSWRDAENVEAFLEEDRAFQRAIQAFVAARHVQVEHWPLDEENRFEPFPRELADAVLLSASDYERAITACRQIAPRSTVDEFAACERRITEARTAMRYRSNQLLMHLGLGDWMDWEGFDQIVGWKPGDYATDQVVSGAKS